VTYKIELRPAAVRSLAKLETKAQRRVQAAIELLADTPRPPGAVMLKGDHGLLRVRTGDYRIVYEVRDSLLLVLVITIGHRSEVYRRRR
jgi:mRNA interferase RelE/StbE